MGKVWAVGEVEVAKPETYIKRYAVGEGLVLAVHPSGRRLTWERSYTQDGKLRWLTFGVFKPKDDPRYISEIKARALNEEFKEKRTEGVIIQPTESNLTLGTVIEKYLETIKHPSTKQSYRSCLNSLKDLFNKKWQNINDNLIEKELSERVEDQSISLVAAKECFYAIRRVSRFSLLSRNNIPKITLFPHLKFSDLKFGKLETVNYPAITNEIEFKELYKAIKARWRGTEEISIAAILVLAHFPKRPSEIINMKWEYIDFENKEIRFPAAYEKVKTWKLDYPMSDWLYDFLKKIPEVYKTNEYVFSVRQGKPITQQALRFSLKQLSEGKHSPHSFRASFRTIGEYLLKYDIHNMELTLGHKTKDPNKGAYRRGTERRNMEERREMMNSWSSWLES